MNVWFTCHLKPLKPDGLTLGLHSPPPTLPKEPLYKILWSHEGYSLMLGFLCHFGLKTGVHFAYFGLESSMVFELQECMNVFIVSIPNK